jgi:hypothetical protein
VATFASTAARNTGPMKCTFLTPATAPPDVDDAAPLDVELELEVCWKYATAAQSEEYWKARHRTAVASNSTGLESHVCSSSVTSFAISGKVRDMYILRWKCFVMARWVVEIEEVVLAVEEELVAVLLVGSVASEEEGKRTRGHHLSIKKTVLAKTRCSATEAARR